MLGSVWPNFFSTSFNLKVEGGETLFMKSYKKISNLIL